MFQIKSSAIDDLSIDYSRQGEPRKFSGGLRIGAPFLAGIRLEYAIRSAEDFMPIYAVTGDISLTLGYSVSIMTERRVMHSPCYIGIGYNYWRFMFYGTHDIHSIETRFGLRTSYKKQNSLNLMIGGLVIPVAINHYYLFPCVHISMVRISRR